MNLLRQLPNALTLINLLLGTLAIFWLPSAATVIILLLVLGCLVADIFDGALARRMGVAGPLGIQLDSLADVVSFGVLPAYVIYQIAGDLDIVPILLAGLIAVSAGLRLARFNVDTRSRQFFWGLATPAGTILVMSILWAYTDLNTSSQLETYRQLVIYGVPVFLAVMYQVPLKLPGLKSPKSALITLAFVGLFIVVGFFLWGPISIAMGIVLYVGMGLLNLIIKWY